VFSVDAAGAFTWEQWPFMAGMGGEGPVSTSPSGRYVITKRHVMPPGAVGYKIRKTPLADDDEPMTVQVVIEPDVIESFPGPPAEEAVRESTKAKAIAPKRPSDAPDQPAKQ